jgi:NNMT/PNMT/TEMT family
MKQLTPSSRPGLPHKYRDPAESDHSDAVALPSMVETAAPTRNADVTWNDFPSQDYWHRNYKELQSADKEIIRLVGSFFSKTFRRHPHVHRAIDVGSGTNLYPALLMLPWAEHILLTDYSESNVRWLRSEVMDDEVAWTWQPFWRELQALEGYNQLSEPRKQLRMACTGKGPKPTVEERSVFDLPSKQWQLGTMFFVAESITRDREEFEKAIASFVGALEPHSPFAAAFMKGSEGYPLGETDEVTYPALPVTAGDIRKHLIRLRVSKLSVKELETLQLVRDDYEGMIVATGITGEH